MAPAARSTGAAGRSAPRATRPTRPHRRSAPPLPARLLCGMLAGGSATLPMTAAMLAMHFGIPGQQQHPLAPLEITTKLVSSVRRVGVHEAGPVLALTAFNHVGYGSAVGMPFGLLPVRTLPASLGAGSAYGLAVFIAGYFGWLPLTRIMRPTREYPPPRVATIAGAHIVWGATLGAFAHTLARPIRLAAPTA